MKLSTQSHKTIVSVIQKALEKYSSAEVSMVTDFYLQPNLASGKLTVFNDDDEELAGAVIEEWVEAMPEDFYQGAEMALKKALNQLKDSGTLNALKVLKPYSFVLVDAEKETVAELMLVDEDDTLFLSEELLKGLDEELNAFLKDLLEK